MATTEIYTLSLHDALPISAGESISRDRRPGARDGGGRAGDARLAHDAVRRLDAGRRDVRWGGVSTRRGRSEEHTSELQSRLHLVCRLLLEKKKKSCQDSVY